MTRPLLLAALAACGNPDEPARVCHDVFYVDADGDAFGDPESSVEACEVPDGYTAAAGDCDDTRYSTRPGADERCNGEDDDCDGSVDEDAIDPAVWFLDTDGDGYGEDARTMEGCVAPPGYAAGAGDCNEKDPAIHPGADEVCDGGVDNDCDHLPDEDDPGLQGELQTWYVDGDYDGFGDPLAPILACDQPLGGVPDNTDCNDDEGAAYPGAREICDHVDNDCDKLFDEDDDDVSDQRNYWPDADGDGLGAGVSVFQCFAPSGYADNRDDCDDGDAAVGEPVLYYEDDDLDGYGDRVLGETCSTDPGLVFVDGDCDDARADVLPGATEICDGIDDNCDGLVDDDDPTTVLPIWYGDDDGDGFGEDTDLVESCVELDGYVAAGGDCDDGDDFTFPDAPELCDGIDNDCNATADDSIDYIDWYADVDGDGHGDAADSLNDCSQPSGYVLPNDDCDDASVDVHPDAVEVCANAVDDDCNGTLDNCPTELSGADLVVEGVELNAMFASSMAVGDVDANGTSDLVVGAPGWSDPGVVFVLLGPASGIRTIDDLIKIPADTDGTDLGSDVAAGDVDGDAADDLLLGAPALESAYLFLGPLSGDRALIDADAVLEGAARDLAGAFVDIVFDVDGDGAPDMLVGEPSGGTAGRGRLYVVSGASSGTIDLAADATYTFASDAASAALGTAGVDVGDASGDGIDDLALSAPGADTGGVVYVVEGGLSAGTYDVEDDPLARLRGEDASWFGASIASSDYDGDGTMDLFVGAPIAVNAAGDPAGAVFGYLGPLDDAIETSDAHVRWDSSIDGAFLGGAVAADGDVDGDKTPDVLMGAHLTPIDSTAQGCAYLQLGLASGSIDVASLRSFPAESLDATGYSLRFVPDWDGDDGSEVALGSPIADTSGGADVGAAHVFLSGTLIP